MPKRAALLALAFFSPSLLLAQKPSLTASVPIEEMICDAKAVAIGRVLKNFIPEQLPPPKKAGVRDVEVQVSRFRYLAEIVSVPAGKMAYGRMEMFYLAKNSNQTGFKISGSGLEKALEPGRLYVLIFGRDLDGKPQLVRAEDYPARDYVLGAFFSRECADASAPK